MRTRIIPLELAHKHWYKRICEFIGCYDPPYFSTTPTSRCCCDDHRFKKYQLTNKTEIDQAKLFTAQFKKNGLGLKKLYSMGIIKPTAQELKIVDYDFDVRNDQIELEGKTAFRYFEYSLIFEINGTCTIIKNKKI